MDFRGFDSNIILILRDGILMSIGHFPECLSQAILVGIILVERLGVEAELFRGAQGTGRGPGINCVYAYYYYQHYYYHYY